MTNMDRRISPPESLNELIEDIRQLPGVGRKTATRYAYWLIGQEQTYLTKLAKEIHKIKTLVRQCKICFNTSEGDICSICSNPIREIKQICIVEYAEDILQLERVEVFQGRYHVLGGVIDPLKGTHPEDLHITELFIRLKQEDINDIIIATSPTAVGDRTAQYIRQQLKDFKGNISTLGRGLANGTLIEYADKDTLIAAFQNRK
jgi:recombination protein RecR